MSAPTRRADLTAARATVGAASRSRLLDLPHDLLARAERFEPRKAAWRAGAYRYAPPHPEIAAHAPLVLLGLPQPLRAESLPLGCVALDTVGGLIRLDAKAGCWGWYCRAAEGRGLYELVAWIADLSVSDAAAACWAMINAEGGDE